jgi:hypothetical protein
LNLSASLSFSHLTSLLEHSAHDYPNRPQIYRQSPLDLNLSRRFFTQLHLSSLVSTSPLEMAAPPHDGWPKVGDIFPHWSDLLLATQLAALRSGYNDIGKHWDPKSPERVATKCNVHKSARRSESCQGFLVQADLEEMPGKAIGGCIVAELRNENLEVGRHRKHVGGLGTSKGFKVSTVRPCRNVGEALTMLCERSGNPPNRSNYQLAERSKTAGRCIDLKLP